MAVIIFVGIHPVVLVFMHIFWTVRTAASNSGQAKEWADDLAGEMATEVCIHLGYSEELIAELIKQDVVEVQALHEAYHFRMEQTNMLEGEAREAALAVMQTAAYATTLPRMLCRALLGDEAKTDT